MHINAQRRGLRRYRSRDPALRPDTDAERLSRKTLGAGHASKT